MNGVNTNTGYSREVRLGLVLYGGVSLAVYENGVVQELYRAVRGEGVYRLIKDLTDSDIVVDIISGTSAGGVNGVMLAYCLANNKDFAPVAELWRTEADINRLLSADRTDKEHTCILNSKYYHDKLEKCFVDLSEKGAKPTGAESLTDELYLYVTGTDANGAISTFYDDAGHAVDIKNHRALFKLCRRHGQNDFEQTEPADLAKLCRVTSCFPTAFKPVEVKGLDPNPDLHRWNPPARAAVYLDGGILNNKPFTSTIDQIYRRAATREVERFLIYVDPEPDALPIPNDGAALPLPNVVDAAKKALLSIPRYQSIWADLEAIERHNERAEKIARLLGALNHARSEERRSISDAKVCENPLDKDPRNAVYYGCRLVQLRDAAVYGILNTKDGRGHFKTPEVKRSGRLVVESFSNRTNQNDAETLERYDIFFRQRRAHHLARTLMSLVKDDRTRAAQCSEAWDVVNPFFRLYDELEQKMRRALDEKEFCWRNLSSEYPDLEMQIKEVQTRKLQAIADGLWGAVKRVLDEVLLSGSSGCNLLLETDRHFAEGLSRLPDSRVKECLCREFVDFLDIDRQLLPVQLGGAFESPDAVRVVRFSSVDEKLKVYGTALAAFGGFFNKQWRANDIAVGRINGSCELIKCLLTPARLSDMRQSGRFKGVQFTTNIVQGYFGNELPSAHAVHIATRLTQFFSEGSVTEQDAHDSVAAIFSGSRAVIEKEEDFLPERISSSIPVTTLARTGVVGALQGAKALNAAFWGRRKRAQSTAEVWTLGLGVMAFLALRWKLNHH